MHPDNANAELRANPGINRVSLVRRSANSTQGGTKAYEFSMEDLHPQQAGRYQSRYISCSRKLQHPSCHWETPPVAGREAAAVTIQRPGGRHEVATPEEAQGCSRAEEEVVRTRRGKPRPRAGALRAREHRVHALNGRVSIANHTCCSTSGRRIERGRSTYFLNMVEDQKIAGGTGTEVKLSRKARGRNRASDGMCNAVLDKQSQTGVAHVAGADPAATPASTSDCLPQSLQRKSCCQSRARHNFVLASFRKREPKLPQVIVLILLIFSRLRASSSVYDSHCQRFPACPGAPASQGPHQWSILVSPVPPALRSAVFAFTSATNKRIDRFTFTWSWQGIVGLYAHLRHACHT